jgi:transcriptional regulator with XRE-family HTH domain
MANREGDILRERREELGLTQEQVAFELHMSTHQYQRFEYGHTNFSNCRMRTGLRICAVLELDPYEVVFEK